MTNIKSNLAIQYTWAQMHRSAPLWQNEARSWNYKLDDDTAYLMISQGGLHWRDKAQKLVAKLVKANGTFICFVYCDGETGVY